MIQKFIDFIAKAKITQTQTEAVLDLLILMYQIDGKIRIAEHDFFLQWLSEIKKWKNPIRLEVYHSDAIAKCRKHIDENTITHLLDSIVSRLVNTDEDHVVQLAIDMAYADKELVALERQVLAEFVCLLETRTTSH